MFTQVHDGEKYGEFSVSSREIYPLRETVPVRIKCSTMQDIEAQGIRVRIALEIESQRLTTRELSIKAGMNPDTLGKFMAGKTQSLKASNLSAVAQVLKVSESYLLGTDFMTAAQETAKPFGVRFGGIVEAGPFRPDDGLNQDNEWRFIPVPPDPRYPISAQYAFEVRGDSMTKAHIVEGMYVLAVDMETWVKLHGPLPSGKLVVVERTRNGHPERELTVKRLRYFRDSMELHPESHNPVHQPLVFPLPLSGGDMDNVRISAVLLQSTWIHG